MDNFLGLVRDTLKINNPVGTWQNGKNMVLTEKARSIANEDGFEFKYNIPGIVIGKIVTNKDIVYFIKNNEGVDEIGRVNLQEDVPSYTRVFKTNLLSFSLNCPIEGVFIYNFKGDLIVAWCDGVFENSNSLRSLNLTNLPFEVDTEGELLDILQFSLLNQFPNVNQGKLTIDYTTNGSFSGYGIYVTFSYLYNDRSKVGYFPISNIAYVGKEIDPTQNLGLKLLFEDLDSSFDKLKIGVVINTESEEGTEASLLAYESKELSYNGSSFSITLNNLNNFVESNVESLIITNTIFEKVNTITKVDNEVEVGNVVTLDNNIKFQKFANLLELVPYYYRELDENKQQEPTLMPDEVYAIYIQVQLLNGVYSDAYHIAGRKDVDNENQDLTAEQIEEYDLAFTEDLEDVKQFHIFNKGYARGMFRDNEIATTEENNKFGYFSVKDIYPNNEEYNSTIDYEGNLIVGGEDLRGEPIRYHRCPSLLQMKEESRTDNDNLISIENQTEFVKYKIGVKVTNFNSIVPQEVKDKIQGYRLLHIKRNGSNNYIAGNWCGIRRKDHDDEIAQTNPDGFFENYDFGYYGLENPNVTFQRLRVIGNELFKFRPALSPTFVMLNFPIRVVNMLQYGVSAFGVFPVIENESRFSKCLTSLEYRPGNSISENTEYHEEGINLDLKEGILPINVEDLDPPPYGTNPFLPEPLIQQYAVNLTAYNFNTNIYQGFDSDDLNIINRTNDLSNNIKFKGGDCFYTSKQELYLRSRVRVINPDYTNGSQAYLLIRRFLEVNIKDLYCPLNFSLLKNDAPVDRDTTDETLLAAGDYDFDLLDKDTLNSINDITTNFTFNINNEFINKFPFRIYQGLTVANETLDLSSFTTFLPDNYYEMPNDKGEITALRGHNRKLYIQCRYALFVATIKDSLKTNDGETFLGSSDLFDRLPQEIFADEDGYVGSISKFACKIIKSNYVTINSFTGQIFLISDSTQEISAKGNKNWFWENFKNTSDYYYLSESNKNSVDNPYNSVGYLIEFDKEYNRLIVVKKYFEFIRTDLISDVVSVDTVNFDGEFYSTNGNLIDFNNTNYFINKSITLSYTLEKGGMWAFEHDYYPNLIFNNINSLFSIINKLDGNRTARLYKHNNKTVKGLYYGNKEESYVDIIFNGQRKETKKYQMFNWITTVINAIGGEEQFKTITHVAVYNNNQCSGVINLKNNQFVNNRNVEGEWNFNSFRDLVINPSFPVIEDNGDINESNLNFNKSWFDKSNFISKFIVLRLISDNIDNNKVYINQVNSKAIISKR